MKVTARCLAVFGPLLQPADLAVTVAQPGAGGRAGPDASLDSLIRFEGALAWESGAPRSAVPVMVLDWAQESWLAGWDHADAHFYHAEVPGLRRAA